MNGASSYSDLVDKAFIFILGTSVLLLIGLTAVMIYFMVRYRRSKNPNPAQIADNPNSLTGRYLQRSKRHRSSG